MYGISGNLLLCIKSFLTNRKQAVRIGNSLSSFRDVISGVQQGSVLGPFLFLLFINDLPDVFDEKVHSKLFADDLKAFDVCDKTCDNTGIQSALDSLVEWCSKWQLNISASKSGSLLITGSPVSKPKLNLELNGVLFNTFQSTRDLGVIIDNSLSFAPHISSIVSKANQRIYLLLKTFKNRTIKLMIFAFKVYVLPLLDYCSPIWSPFKLEDIDRLERVQRCYTKKLENLKYLSYSERLKKCELPTLELRRLRNDLILCYKIAHNLVALDFSDLFKLANSTHCTRGHKFKLEVPKVINRCRKNFFAIRLIPIWNKLPDNVVLCTSLDTFKRQLMTVNLSKYLRRDF